jgi:hypothetical protein
VTLPALEFIRCFLLHVLSNRFVRIRHTGIPQLEAQGVGDVPSTVGFVKGVARGVENELAGVAAVVLARRRGSDGVVNFVVRGGCFCGRSLGGVPAKVDGVEPAGHPQAGGGSWLNGWRREGPGLREGISASGG